MSYIKFDKKYFNGVIKPLILKGHTFKNMSSLELITCSPPTAKKLTLLYGNDKIVKKSKENTKNGKSHYKVDLIISKEIVHFSELGYGIEKISKKLSVKLHPTTVMLTLKRILTPIEYESRHSKLKFTTYWSGRYFHNERGDLLQSGLEEYVVDYLFGKNIEYSTCKYVLCTNGHNKMYCDVFIPKQKLISNDLYIEVFGMSDLDFYIAKMKQKLINYKDLNLILLPLYRKDFNKKEDYKVKLQTFLNQYYCE